MKVGDRVRLPGYDQVRIISKLKSDSRGIWIQFEETSDDTWYWSSQYEVIE